MVAQLVECEPHVQSPPGIQVQPVALLSHPVSYLKLSYQKPKNDTKVIEVYPL